MYAPNLRSEESPVDQFLPCHESMFVMYDVKGEILKVLNSYDKKKIKDSQLDVVSITEGHGRICRVLGKVKSVKGIDRILVDYQIEEKNGVNTPIILKFNEI